MNLDATQLYLRNFWPRYERLAVSASQSALRPTKQMKN